MKIRIASDLYVDFHADRGRSIFGELAAGDFDALVIAGDLCGFRYLESALAMLCDAAAPRPVVYVLGNHEPYGGSWELVEERVREVSRENLGFLERGAATIEGRRFVGCTLWYPHSGLPEERDRSVSDFDAIADIRAWLPATARASAKFLADNVTEGDVVVTHYLPHPRSIAPRYAGSPLNAYFLHDVSPTVEAGDAALWIHGHTHVSCDYVAGHTRVVCNPLGYARFFFERAERGLSRRLRRRPLIRPT